MAAERRKYRLARKLDGHDGAVLCVRYTKEGRYCMTAGADRSVRLWKPSTGMAIKRYLGGHGREVMGVAIADDNSRFASCGSDRGLFLWDVKRGTVLRKLYGHSQRVNSVSFCAVDGQMLVTGSDDASVMLWDIRSRSKSPIQTLRQFKDAVLSVLATETEIVGGCVDGSVRTFDIRAGAVHTDLLHAAVTSIALSNDGNCLLASCLDDSLRLLEKRSGELLAEYGGHVNGSAKLECTFVHTDESVCAGDEDNSVAVWDLVGGGIVQRLDGAHRGMVASLAAHPSEYALLTASYDGSVAVWECE
eukprot:PLAT7131.1.p1 GENE.PLAT7131.1~~PLAT7131.1.p1  ORF type:complete len:304 (+),score=92.84 PLAT7131.1:66-977(+)